MVVDEHPIHRVRQEAGACVRCRDDGLTFRHDDRRWALPLFHKDATCPSRIVFVAEAPNLSDTFDPDKGRLTVDAETDPTGRFMRQLLESVCLTPEDVLVTNTSLCLPAKKAGKFPVQAVIARNCRPWLERLIVAAEARVVVTWGGVALAGTRNVERHKLELRESVGKLHPWFGRLLLPLYHPGLLARKNRSTAQQLEDISCLRTVLLKETAVSQASLEGVAK
ncbi:MAG: uracil-DNA glycosylase family protein [Pseudomonadota bacterium]